MALLWGPEQGVEGNVLEGSANKDVELVIWTANSQKLEKYFSLFLYTLTGESENHRLEKMSKNIKSSFQPKTTMPAKPYPEVPHLHVF